MTRFPQPIPLPEEVSQDRDQRRKEVLSSAKLGIFIRLCVILFELLGVYLYGSSALLMDALASFLDIFSSLVMVLFIIWAAKPPDADHPFGHGRYEPLIGLQLGIMLAVFGVVAMLQQGGQLAAEATGTVLDPKVWLFPFTALIFLELCYHIVIRVAKKHGSPALAADAIHYRIDAITSLFATIALLLGAYMPEWGPAFDHLGAIVIALIMIGLGVYAALSNVHQLMDRVPDELYFDKVRQGALRVAGVRDTEKVRIQLYGPDAHVDIDIEVDPDMSVEVAHEISQKVRAEIQKEWPAVRDVTVHIEPYYPGDHS